MAKQLLTQLGSRFRLTRTPTVTVPYVRNATASVELPNTLLNRKLVIRLSGNLIVGVANAAAIFSEAPVQLIKTLEIKGDRRKTLFSARGDLLYRYAHFTRQKQAELSPPLGTVGTRAFSVTFTLDHEAIRFMDPSESLFDPRIYKKVELFINWGAETDIATAGGGGGTIAIDIPNTSLDVIVQQTGVGVGQRIFDHILVSDEVAIVASLAKLQLKVPQAGLLAGVMFQSTSDAGAGAGPVPVDTIINTVRVFSDTTLTHVDPIKWATLQRENVVDYQLDGGATPGAQIPGYAYLSFVENGMFSSPINVNALNQTLLELNVSFTGGQTQVVRVLYDFFEPVRSLVQQSA